MEKWEKDDALEKVVNSFSKGSPYNYNEKLNIVKEGHYRYLNQIPPGYMDAVDENGKEGNAKKGFEKFGDLFVWKEILKYSESNKKDVLFITEDHKEDWYEKKTMFPRRELIEEFSFETKREISFCNLEGFIWLLRSYFEKEIAEPSLFEDIDAIVVSIDLMKKTEEERKRWERENLMVFEYKTELFEIPLEKFVRDLDWYISDEERNMGLERSYFAEYEYDDGVVFTFQIYEYPQGSFNGQSVNCMCPDVNIIREPDLEDWFYYEVQVVECEACMEDVCVSVLDENGLCPECSYKFRKLMEED